MGLAVLLLLQPPPLYRPWRNPEIVPDLTRDVVKLAPGQYSVDLENERVRVLRARLAPDAVVPLHDARDGVLVAVTEAHVRLIRPDKRMHYVDLAPGQAQWVVEDSYSVKNLGDRPVEFLFVEMKRQHLRTGPPRGR